MAYEIGTVTDTSGSFSLAHYNMIEKIRNFAVSQADIFNVQYSGNGTGTLSGETATSNAVDETWTLECIATATDGGTFSVSGEITGSTSDATVGDPYDNGKIKFTIQDGDVDFDLGDTFTFDSIKLWKEQRYDTSKENHELILKGVGFTGEEDIFVGFRTYQSETSDYYNLVAASFTGFLSDRSFDNQPQAILSGVPAHNLNINYWLSLNPQHIKFALDIEGNYQSAYVGKFLPYARPSQFPHPIVNAGMLNGTPETRYSNDNYSMPYRGNEIYYRNFEGTWVKPGCYPWSNDSITGSWKLRDTNNHYPLVPVELYEGGKHLLGALDGIYFIPGFNNTVENTLVIDGVTYVVMRDVTRTGFDDYYAIRMDI